MMKSMSFNQNNTELAVATKAGFSLYNLSEIDTTLRETHRDTKEKLKIEQSAQTEDIFLIERHYEEPIVAIVPVSKRRRLVLWDYGRGKSFPEKDKKNFITAVKFYKRNVIIFTEREILMHDIARITYVDEHKEFKISFNPKGICAVAHAVVDKTSRIIKKVKTNEQDNDDKVEEEEKIICLVAVPYKIGLQDGQIEIFDLQNWRSYGTYALHSTPVEALAFNASGTLLASASKSGTHGTIYSVIRVYALKTEMKIIRGLPKWSCEPDEKFEFRRDYHGSGSIISLSFSNCSNFIISNMRDQSVSVFSLDNDVTCRKMSKIVVKSPSFEQKEEKEKEEEKKEVVGCWGNFCPTEKSSKKIKGNKKSEKDKDNKKDKDDEKGKKNLWKTCAITTINDQLRVVIVTSDLRLWVYTIPNSVDDKYTCLGYYDLSTKAPIYGHNTMPAEIMRAKLLDYSIYEPSAMYDHLVYMREEKQLQKNLEEKRKLEKFKNLSKTQLEEQEKKQRSVSFKRIIRFSDEICKSDSKIDVTASTSAAAAAYATAVRDAATYEAAAAAKGIAAAEVVASAETVAVAEAVAAAEGVAIAEVVASAETVAAADGIAAAEVVDAAEGVAADDVAATEAVAAAEGVAAITFAADVDTITATPSSSPASSFNQQVVKLEKLFAQAESTPGVSEEWGSGWTGTNFIVEIEETASSANTDYLNSPEDVVSAATINATNAGSGPKIIVRTEEVLIVGLVLMLWVGAIVLFFNRWGKIRMLEPYQPKFQQQHRSSCPLVDIDSIQTHQRASVSRMSMGLVNNFNMPTCQFNTYNPSVYAKGYASHASSSRQRQNSVFVGPSPNQFLMPKPPRKTRSAMDLHSMVLDESAEQV